MMYIIFGIAGAPIFIEPPRGMTITKGELMNLVCYVQGDPFPRVTWLLEGIILEPSESVSFRYDKHCENTDMIQVVKNKATSKKYIVWVPK